MELLDIVDEKEPDRRQCRGRWHTVRESGTARHVWIFRRRGGVVQILCRNWSDNKDDPLL